jgi:hypothetical protein
VGCSARAGRAVGLLLAAAAVWGERERVQADLAAGSM